MRKIKIAEFGFKKLRSHDSFVCRKRSRNDSNQSEGKGMPFVEAIAGYRWILRPVRTTGKSQIKVDGMKDDDPDIRSPLGSLQS